MLESATKLSSRLESLGRLTALVTLKIAERNRLDKLPSRRGWFHSLRTLCFSPGGPRAASKLIAPHGETWLPFPPQSENITERAPGQEGLRGVGGWVQTSCEDRQTQTVLNKNTTSGKASALGVPREEVLGIKVLCAPGPAVQGRSARAPSPALPQP